MAIPLLSAIDIEGKDITADALLTQREIAEYIVGREGHYHFPVKKNQRRLYEDIKLFFKERGEPDFVMHDPPDHGRIETRKIWTTAALNGYLDFPHVGQAFVIERHAVDKKSGRDPASFVNNVTSSIREMNRDASCATKTSRD